MNPEDILKNAGANTDPIKDRLQYWTDAITRMVAREAAEESLVETCLFWSPP